MIWRIHGPVGDPQSTGLTFCVTFAATSPTCCQVLSRSAEDSLLTFDEKGGIKEIPIIGERTVLSDDVIRKLVRAADEIKRIFNGRDQDIEWAYMKGQLYIVQSRPYLPGS